MRRNALPGADARRAAAARVCELSAHSVRFCVSDMLDFSSFLSVYLFALFRLNSQTQSAGASWIKSQKCSKLSYVSHMLIAGIA